MTADDPDSDAEVARRFDRLSRELANERREQAEADRDDAALVLEPAHRRFEESLLGLREGAGTQTAVSPSEELSSRFFLVRDTRSSCRPHRPSSGARRRTIFVASRSCVTATSRFRPARRSPSSTDRRHP